MSIFGRGNERGGCKLHLTKRKNQVIKVDLYKT